MLALSVPLEASVLLPASRTPVSIALDESMDEPESCAVVPVSVAALSMDTPVSSSVDPSLETLVSARDIPSLAPPPSLDVPPSEATQRVRPPLVSQRSLALHAGLQLDTHIPETQVNPSRHEGLHAVGGGGLHAASEVDTNRKAQDKRVRRMDQTITESRVRHNDAVPME